MPKIGSVGERYRIRQLNYQLPKQDIDYAYCKHIGLDKECFEEFVTARNEIALDIGTCKGMWWWWFCDELFLNLIFSIFDTYKCGFRLY